MNFENFASRNQLVLLARIPAISGGTGTLQMIGRRTPDSNHEYNTEKNTETDILGITDTTVDNAERTQTFNRVINNSDFNITEWLTRVYARRAFSELSGIECVLVHAYMGTDGAYFAEQHASCTFSLNNKGGAGAEGRLMEEFEVDFGGEITIGTTDNYRHGTNPVFTPAP